MPRPAFAFQKERGGELIVLDLHDIFGGGFCSINLDVYERCLSENRCCSC